MKQNLSLFAILLLALFTFGCPASKEIPSGGNTGKMVDISNRIIVLLEGKTSPTQLIETFSAYALQSKGPTSRTENRYLLTFDTKLIKPAKMLNKIKNAPSVLEAAFAQELISN